ncbi:hypothetical protein ACHAXT_007618 [Thalassiosira profunda]
MNRLLLSASKSTAASLCGKPASPFATSAARCLLVARHFSDAADAADAEMVGTVKYFYRNKSWGFIVPDGVDMEKHETKDTFFVHRGNIKPTELEDGTLWRYRLKKGQRVKFKAGPTKEGAKSPSATDVAVEDDSHVPKVLPGKRYEKSPHSAEMEGASDALIDKLVTERTKFKMLGEYGKADAIREGLQTKFNVFIDERLRQWSVGGDFGAEQNAERDELGDKVVGRPRGAYVKRGGGDLTAEDEEAISKKIADQDDATKQKDYAAADEIRAELLSKYNVKFDNRSGEWWVDADEYAMAGDNGLSEEEREHVEGRLRERSALKREKSYAEANEIHVELWAKLRVNVDDRSKEWFVETPVGAVEESFESLVARHQSLLST